MFHTSEEVSLQVEGTSRTALVYPGAQALYRPSPLVFVFHGFTGNARHAARLYNMHTAWKEAIVVYPQGLVVNSPRLRRSGPGWQHRPGDYGDRDLRFVEALSKELANRYKVDTKQVYACGMSNGGLFCFVLLVEQSYHFAAFAPVAAAAGLFLARARTPRPVLMINGKADRLVPIEAAERTRDWMRRLNGCGNEEKEWAKGYITYLPVKDNNHVVWHAHEGGHIWTPDATEHIVRFFKEHRLR